MEWLEYVAIRGPVGPDRLDVYAQMISMHAGKPYNRPHEISIADFPMPWTPVDPDASDDDD